MSKLSPYLKALVAALIAALSTLGAYLINDTGVGDVTSGQWVAVAIAFLVSFSAVWAVPNSSP